MSTSISLGRHHLAANRRMIIGRSLAGAVAGVVPVPVLEDWLASRVRRGTIRRIAATHGVDLDDEAVIAIADGPSAPPEWGRIAGATLLVRALSRSWRKMLITYLAAQRARYAAHSFTVATLFDHYCARLHVGLGLDGASATRVRAAMSASMAATSGGLGTTVFRRGVVAAARATVRAPLELADIATGGRLRKRLQRGDEVHAIAEVDSAIERSMEGETGFLGRAAGAIEIQLSSDGNPYLDQLLTRFEEDWRTRGEP